MASPAPTATTILRPAQLADLSSLLMMGADFVEGTPYVLTMQAQPDAWRDLVTTLLTREDALLLVAEDAEGLCGMIGALVGRHPLTGTRTASELFFWVDPEARGTHVGVRLLRACEAWATAQDADCLLMTAPTDRVSAFYERLGYQKFETTYRMTLNTEP